MSSHCEKHRGLNTPIFTITSAHITLILLQTVYGKSKKLRHSFACRIYIETRRRNFMAGWTRSRMFWFHSHFFKGISSVKTCNTIQFFAVLQRNIYVWMRKDLRKIWNLFRSRFSIIIDGWSAEKTNYVAVFVSFSDERASNG